MLARRSMLVLANSLLGAAFGYVGLFAIARFMGADVLGVREYALSLVFLAGVITRLGFPTTHARRLGRGDAPAASIGTYALLKLGLTVLFVLLALTGGWIWLVLLDKPLTDLTVTALSLAVLVTVVRSLRDILANTFQGLHMTLQRESVVFTNTFATVLMTVLFAIAYAWSHGRWSPVPRLSQSIAELVGATAPVSFEQAVAWVVGAFLVGELAALLVGVGLFAAGHIPVERPRRDIARAYIHGTIPLMMVALGAVLLKRVDQVMIGFWFDARELGQYAAAMKLSDLLLVLALAIEVTLLPLVSRLHKQGDEERLRLVVLAAERWISLLIWPVLVLVALAASPIMHIVLSDDFLAAAPLLVILAFFTFFQSMRIPLKTKAVAIGEHRFAAGVAAKALGLNITLNVVFIPVQVGPVPMLGLGALGASIATLATGIYMLLAFRIQARAWTGYPFWTRHVVKHPVAAAATYGVLLALRPLLPDLARFYDLVWFGFLVLGLYLAALWLMREVGREELRKARDTLWGRPAERPE